MDITLLLMIQMNKITYMAWAVSDFYTPEEKLHKELKGRKISHIPSLFEYLNYAFFFAGYFGPCNDIVDHVQFLNLTGNFAKSSSITNP
jgi:hypothetical protein